MIVNYTHCIHCDKYIEKCNPEYLMETICEGDYIEQRYVCKKCYERFYKFDIDKFKGETND